MLNSIVETSTFSARAARVWTDDEYESFVVYIARNPRAGSVVPGSGGVRKVRWARAGIGKRGGVRVLYFNSDARETWLLTIYAKNERETISASELKKIRDVINAK